MDMKDHADDLARRRARAAQVGGDEVVARQHAAGKLTVLSSAHVLMPVSGGEPLRIVSMVAISLR